MILAGLGIGLWVAWWAVFVRYRSLGLMTPARFAALRLTTCALDGEDITWRCVAADDRQGWALLLRHRNGYPFVVLREEDFPGKLGDIAVEVRHGAVRFT